MTLTTQGITLIHMKNSTHHLHTTYHPTTHPHMTTARWIPTRTEIARRRRKAKVVALVTIAIIAGAYLLGQSIDSKYDYSCPTMLVTAVDGDTLSEITERYCQGHTLQASWDIAHQRGTADLNPGDTIQLGGK